MSSTDLASEDTRGEGPGQKSIMVILWKPDISSARANWSFKQMPQEILFQCAKRGKTIINITVSSAISHDVKGLQKRLQLENGLVRCAGKPLKTWCEAI